MRSGANTGAKLRESSPPLKPFDMPAAQLPSIAFDGANEYTGASLTLYTIAARIDSPRGSAESQLPIRLARPTPFAPLYRGPKFGVDTDERSL